MRDINYGGTINLEVFTSTNDAKRSAHKLRTMFLWKLHVLRFNSSFGCARLYEMYWNLQPTVHVETRNNGSNNSTIQILNSSKENSKMLYFTTLLHHREWSYPNLFNYRIGSWTCEFESRFVTWSQGDYWLEIDYTLDGHTHSVKPEFNEYPSYI